MHKKNNNILPKKKTNIKIKMECIGFFTPITRVEAPNINDKIKVIKNSIINDEGGARTLDFRSMMPMFSHWTTSSIKT